MEYLDHFAVVLGADSNSAAVQFRLIQENRVARLLRRMGYKFVNVSSGFSPTDRINAADINIGGGIGNTFYVELLLITAFAPIEKHTALLAREFASNRLLGFTNIEQIKKIHGPKFVLIHTLITHPPFIFDANGGIKPLPPSLLNEGYVNKSGYLEQLKFAEKEIQLLVSSLLAQPDYRPIIVVQSDHGPASSQRTDQKSFVNERMKILNAYYFPNNVNVGLHQTITPVNSFRVIFNRYFQANFPLLKDVSYISDPIFHFHFTNVNDQISH